MAAFVVDTNVALAANGKASHAPIECQLNCVETLQRIVERDLVVVDDKGFILNEYHDRLNFNGQPGVGDYFYRYIFDNQGHQDKVEKVSITPIGGHGNFHEFPNDPALNNFDLSDRKFVAVALTSNSNPIIINATDTDWAHYDAVLQRHGLSIRYLCPSLVAPDNN